MHARLVPAFALAAALLIQPAGRATAQTTPRPAHTQATLVSDTSTIIPGQPFTIAIKFEIDPKWHIYYKNPGDSGLAPRVTWTLPEGLTAGELQFPEPNVLKSPAGVNYIYENEAALLVTMTPGKDFKIGRAIEIAGALKWLECDEDQCVPQKQGVNIAVTADEHVTPTNVEDFKTWREKVKAGESFDPATAR